MLKIQDTTRHINWSVEMLILVVEKITQVLRVYFEAWRDFLSVQTKWIKSQVFSG